MVERFGIQLCGETMIQVQSLWRGPGTAGIQAGRTPGFRPDQGRVGMGCVAGEGGLCRQGGAFRGPEMEEAALLAKRGHPKLW